MTDRIAVVTGAGSGIGRAVSRRLAAAGLRVAAADIDLAAAKQTAVDISAEGHGQVSAFPVDVADASAVEALRDQVADEVGTPRTLVNVAGWDETDEFLNSTAAFAEKVVAINYLGQVHMCRTFLPGMVKTGLGGTVVNIASDAGRVGSSGETIYAGAKGGVIALTKSLAREMARHQINVNCVCPGPTDTPLFRGLPEKLQGALIKAIPLRRLADPDEIAAAVQYFASDDASYVTGQVLSVSGGLTTAG